jgi:hypothetical protein
LGISQQRLPVFHAGEVRRLLWSQDRFVSAYGSRSRSSSPFPVLRRITGISRWFQMLVSCSPSKPIASKVDRVTAGGRAGLARSFGLIPFGSLSHHSRR